MKIYLLCAGNKYEGLEPHAAFKTYERALEEQTVLDGLPQFYGMDKNADQYESTITEMELIK